MSQSRLVIAGGSGFIGRALAAEFCRRGFPVAVLTRSPRPRRDGVVELAWDGIQAGPWAEPFAGALGVINLAGESINQPHTPGNLHRITASRTDSVRALARAVAGAAPPPSVWVQASAVGFYGDTSQAACDENAPAGTDALARICERWEGEFRAADLPQTRKVILRNGLVLGRGGGALPVLARMTRWFLGGAAGTGRQYISWIHLSDLTAVFAKVVEDSNFSGVYNAVAPQPATNADFMRALRRALHRPWSPPVPALAVKLGARFMGSEGSLALVSQRCVPDRLLAAGFRFQFAQVSAALHNLCLNEA